MNFFDTMGQILRIKYHTDPSSLSCILEVFFSNIYSMLSCSLSYSIISFRFLSACDGRLIHPHELKLLSDNNNFFVFYAIMMDVGNNLFVK